MDKDVLVVIGVGGMGRAIASRLSAGKAVLLADSNEATLLDAASALAADGHAVTAQQVDVSSPGSVAELAKAATDLGRVAQVVNTAGLNASGGTTEAILRVDLLGTALVLEEFGGVIAAGGAGVFIASMAGHLGVSLTRGQEVALATAPAAELLDLPFVSPAAFPSPPAAYGVAKRANQLRVQAASLAWGGRGARVNSISPGIISTAAGQHELTTAHGDHMRAMIEASGTRRIGTPADIAAAAAFLLSPEASFITGTDLLVDGGVVAAARSGRLSLPA